MLRTDTAAARSRGLKELVVHHFDSELEVYNFLTTEIVKSRMSYLEMAQKARCHPSTVAKMAHGETRFPRFSTVFNLLRALDYEVTVR